MPLKKLAIYYGYPSLVNDAKGNLDIAASHFQEFNIVVLGANLEKNGKQLKPKHEDHDNTKKIIAKTPNTEFFGYINLGITNAGDAPASPEEIKTRIGLWKEMGAKGIFFDACGFDFGVTRDRQQKAFLEAHTLGLKVFANAHIPEDIYSEEKVALNAHKGGNPNGIKPEVRKGDLFLFEDFIFSQGTYQDPDYMRIKLNKLNAFKEKYGIETFGMSTFKNMDDNIVGQFNYLFYSGSLFNLNGIAITDPNHSSSSNKLFRFIPSHQNKISFES